MILQRNKGLSTYQLSVAMKTAEAPGPKGNLETWGEVLSLSRAQTASSGGAPQNQHPETLSAKTCTFHSGVQRSQVRSQKRHAC